MVKRPEGPSSEASTFSSALDRLQADRHLGRWGAAVAAVLLVWFLVGFFRDPRATWIERCIVGGVALCFALPVAVGWYERRRLPALDRTPRTATVIAHRPFNSDPEPESFVDPYVLIEVDVDGETTPALIADIVATESLDRFAVGSRWSVYAFEDPSALSHHGGRAVVILSESHDDVIRTGYDLGSFSLHRGPGLGSDLLLRRFANDPRH